MQKVLGIGGLFFRSENPEQLAKWYETHLGISVVPTSYEQEPWHQDARPTVFAPFKGTQRTSGSRNKAGWSISGLQISMRCSLSCARPALLEIGCGPGVAARAILERIGKGYILAIDRSAKAIAQAKAGSATELATGRLEFRQIAIESFVLGKSEKPYDLALAVRVGALDGRHPEAGLLALRRIRAALSKNGRLFIDGGDPLKEVALA